LEVPEVTPEEEYYNLMMEISKTKMERDNVKSITNQAHSSVSN